MATWINFSELREQISFEEVLRHYDVEVKAKNGQHLGFCPLPTHQGKRNSPSFSANMERKIFHCFGCQAKGNILEFAMLMEGKDPEDKAALRKVAILLRDRFCPVGHGVRKEKKRESEPELAFMPKGPEPISNEPLDFELKGLDRGHPYLLGRKFAAETIAHFGIGFCSRGSLAERVAIPLRDTVGQLIGYAGRVVDDNAITAENPKYRFPGKRVREDRMREFKKSLFLYNGYRFKSPREDLVVVEGFPSVWWFTQNGYPSVVSTMGAECSEEQAELIVRLVKPEGHIWAMPDGDKAGRKFGASLLTQLAPRRFVRLIELEDGRQPTDLTVMEMKEIFGR